MKHSLFEYGFLTLTVAFAMTMCCSCNKQDENIINPDPQYKQEGVDKDEPTEDLMEEVLHTMSALYGAPSAGFASSLINRFQTIEAFNPNTQVCVITDEAIKAGMLKTQDYLNIYDCYSNGGAVLFLSPTHTGFNEIFQKGLAEALISQSVSLFNIRVDGEDLNSNSSDCYFPKAQIPEDGSEVWTCLGFSQKDILYCEDVDGDGQVGENGASPYQTGLRADAVVRWINDLLSPANGIEEEIARARCSVEFVHDIYYYDVRDQVYGITADQIFKWLRKTEESFVERIYYVSAHDTGSHTDYYLITQDVDFNSGKIDPVPYINNPSRWWGRYNLDIISGGVKIGTLNKQYFTHQFINWESKLGIRMPGKSISIRQSSPQADNNSSSETTTVTNGTMESQTNGLSVGGSFGASVGGGIASMVNWSYSHSWTTGTTHTVGVGTTRNKKDITISKDVDVKEQTVTWTYNGKPGSYWKDKNNIINWNIGNLLISSMSQTNSMLVSIPDVTSGSATLAIDNKWTYRTNGFVGTYTKPNYLIPLIPNVTYDPPVESTFGYVDATHTDHREIELPAPFRFTQTWFLNCISYGDMVSSTDKSNLWADVEKNMLSNSSSFLLAENTADGTVSARELMTLFMRDFASRAAHYRTTYNASGKFKFKLTRRDGSGEITAEYDME